MGLENFSEGNKQNEKQPELEIKGEISPDEDQILYDLSQKTGIKRGEYNTLYTLYRQAQIVNNVKDFIDLAQQPGFDLIVEKFRDKNLPLTEFLRLIGSKPAGEIAKEEENFKKLMGEEDNK
jgi:hypothetical protein